LPCFTFGIKVSGKVQAIVNSGRSERIWDQYKTADKSLFCKLHLQLNESGVIDNISPTSLVKRERNTMNITAEKIVTDAMELPPALRAFVAEKLIESLDESDSLPLSAQWKEEILRRCAEIDKNGVQLRDVDAIFKKAYASLT
jgi:putative addiction module component (TIGR02574 family)